jgi:hypothetical protein
LATRRKRQKSCVQVTPQLRNRSSDPTVTARIKTELEETNDCSSTDQPSEPLWYESIKTSRPTRRVFRVRQCKKDTKSTKSATYKNEPSLWALQEGCIRSYARAIPLDNIKTSEAAKDFLQVTPQIIAYCRNQYTFFVRDSHSITLYVNGYNKMFCKMQKGDIVVLLVPPAGRTGKGRAPGGPIKDGRASELSRVTRSPFGVKTSFLPKVFPVP